MKNIDGFLTAIKEFLKPHQVNTDPTDLAFYAQDWSKVLTPNASAILFPESTTQTSEILKHAQKFEIKIVPSGGRTGLSGGAVAQDGEVVVSLTKLNFIGPIHQGALTLRVGAGAITEAVHQFCKPHGLTWPVDFASKGSSTIGGNLATNAGGIRVLRYGNTRNWVLGITAVLANGDIVELNHELEKNNTGYDLRQLMIGSEGTIGVITEATLKLCPLPASTLVFFFSVENFQKLIELFSFARRRFAQLSAFECLDHASLESVIHHFHLPHPVKERGSVYAVMEIENTHFDEASAVLTDIFEADLVLDGVMAQNEKEAAKLWHYREGVAESILAQGHVHQEDVSVPVAKLEDFYAEIGNRYKKHFPHFEVFFFGHIGDGNLHIFIKQPEGIDLETFRAEAKKSDLELFKLLETYHGSVSAEHGIGILKKHAIQFSKSKSELQLMKSVKLAFDSENTLNPGKIITL